MGLRFWLNWSWLAKTVAVVIVIVIAVAVTVEMNIDGELYLSVMNPMVWCLLTFLTDNSSCPVR